ncbi:uncharacterized protein B0H18DRAFT_83127 [Fomitopsis serialis]|uniref:uncharacterized protein n=1 Tax=Fomitopsis serialis TaxID=139415 RepID=UPI002007FB60|nr:uncharacterized protein B0H18DRAFT_83127 [Neoantrodia serialis]KAH9931412.1 hypothetical protein B0H18DRAFT_83127 [Neoantrodia serialis]
MSDLQPTVASPPSPDASHTQVMPSSADDLIDLGQSSADKQDDEGPGADEQSDEEPSADEWIVQKYTETRTFRRWRDACFQGTLPLTLSARVPLEIFELVIDKMDSPALTAAALVCAAWYPRAMRNLYHTIDIGSRTSYDMLFKQCNASPRVKRWLARTRVLVVHEPSASSPSGNKTKSHSHFLQALPSALANLMPRVRTLDIWDGRLRFVRPDFFLALSRFKSVKSLMLFDCQLSNVTQLRRIVSAFPGLHTSRCKILILLSKMLPATREPHYFKHHLTLVFDVLRSAWNMNRW